MNIFWVILIVIGLVVIFTIFLIFLISAGFREKYGPEWIPAELKINFNCINVNYEDKKIIKFVLSDAEAYQILFQIDDQINEGTQSNKNSFPYEFPVSSWIKIHETNYEFRQSEDNKIKATFMLDTNELIYFKCTNPLLTVKTK